MSVVFSIVILTFGRDRILPRTLARLKERLGAGDEAEVILVDNNDDDIDRASFLAAFERHRVVKNHGNKGVSARNDGMAVASGEFIILLDDDVLIETSDFDGLFRSIFLKHPDVGVINIKKLDIASMIQLPECIPHTNKKVDPNAAFFTFKFIGGVVAIRKAVFLQVGGFSPTIFFGGEEKEYSYRIIGAGWKMYYEPNVIAVELNSDDGRRDRRLLNTELLTNNYKISYLHKPLLALLFESVLFTVFLSISRRGQLSVPRSISDFLDWLRDPKRPRRRPLDRRALDYIRACGGATWR